MSPVGVKEDRRLIGGLIDMVYFYAKKAENCK
jgi:hypothetical protein